MKAAEIVDRLIRAEKASHLGHGVILQYSQRGADEFENEILRLLKALACREPTSDGACGRCESCRIFTSGGLRELAHPDLHILYPSNDRSDYTVDAIKELKRSFSLTRATARNRILLVMGAEGLSAAASAPANALLKILEEPRQDTFLILCTQESHRLLATVKSRCQLYRVSPNLLSPVAAALAEDWQALLRWLDQGGARSDTFPASLPPFNDAYWKERESAIQEISDIYGQAWEALRERWSAWDLAHARRVLAFFQRLESLVIRLKGHGNAGLQWLTLQQGELPRN